MIMELAFANRDLQRSQFAQYYCLNLRAADLKKIRHRTKLGMSHLKLGFV